VCEFKLHIKLVIISSHRYRDKVSVVSPMLELQPDDAASDAMDRYAGGDDLAFGAVYDAVAPRVLALAVRALGDRMLAEDIVQQTLLNVHRARGAFVPGSALMPWVYAIARRLIVDVIRRRKRDQRVAQSEGTAERLPRPATPDEELIACEAAGTLRLAMEALPGSQQTVLHLRREGLPLSMMAAALGTTVTAVKLRLHRAMASLKSAVTAQQEVRRP
jgi:RNA polymerase sigma-70 factor, ECF subfamily